MVTHSIAEYIEKNRIRKNVRWKIADGQWSFEMVANVWCSIDMFDEIFPSYEYQRFNDKGSNPDKTKIV